MTELDQSAAIAGATPRIPTMEYDWRDDPLTRDLVSDLQRGVTVETRAFVKPIFKWMKTGVRKSGQRNDVAVEKAFAFVAWMEQLTRHGDSAWKIAPQPQLDATYALNTVVTSAQRASSRAEAERAIEMLKAFGYTPDVFAYTALIDVIARSRDVAGAFQRYEEMRASSASSRPNLVVFLTVIRAIGFSDEIPVAECLTLMADARRDGVFDDSLYVRTLELCARRRSGEVATQILEQLTDAAVDWKHQQPILRALQRVLQRIPNADKVLEMWLVRGFVSEEDVEAIKVATSMMLTLYTRGASALGCARHVSESARHAVMRHAIDRLIERHLQGARITTDGRFVRSEFETLIHQCRKRKRKDDVVVILNAMREIATNGWTVGTTTDKAGQTAVLVVDPLPQFAPNCATYAAVVETFFACNDEASAWELFLDATTKEFVRDQLLYRKYIRGCCLLMTATHIVELLSYAREDGVVISTRMLSDLAKLHGNDHDQGVDVILNEIPTIAIAEKRILLQELASSSAACQNTEGVKTVIEANVAQGFPRCAITDLAVLESCLWCSDVAQALDMLRDFQVRGLLLDIPVYASLLREIFFKCTRNNKANRSETGATPQRDSRRPAFKMLRLRRGFVEQLAEIQHDLERRPELCDESVYQSNNAAIQYWAQHTSTHAPMMFLQHVLEATATVVDKHQRSATTQTIQRAIQPSEDPLLFIIRAIFALPALSVPFRAQSKLAKQLFSFLAASSPLEIQIHHVAFCLDNLETLSIHVVKELDEVLDLSSQPGGLDGMVAFCQYALQDCSSSAEKTIAFLLSRPPLCSTATAAVLTPTLAQVFVHDNDVFVLKYFKPSGDIAIESQSVDSRRRFLRHVIETEARESDEATRLSRRAIVELKLEHEAEFLPLVVAHSASLSINQEAVELVFTASLAGAAAATTKQTLKLPIASDRVVLVDDDDSLQFAFEVLLYEGSVSRIALDAEWRPAARSSHAKRPYCDDDCVTRCALLQVACDSHVFLFDLLVLEVDDLEDLLSSLLDNESILKLGFRLDGDLQRLRVSFPNTTCFDADEIHNTKDLATGHVGLSSLVEKELGLPLDKTQQCSDWERRPLTRQQIEYAALDAYCLIMLHDHTIRNSHQ